MSFFKVADIDTNEDEHNKKTRKLTMNKWTIGKLKNTRAIR